VIRENAEGDGALDESAARALSLADAEARQLGHDRVGTEHVLLGLLTNGTATSKTLSDAGVTLTAARSKVSEAVGEGAPSRRLPNGLLPRTARVTRALGRSSRFAHARGSERVSSDHVLMGILDVEGIAGQVLRGLGVDVDALRGSLEATTEARPFAATTATPDASRPAPVATCPGCHTSLDVDLVYRSVRARGDDGASRDARLYLCGVCGQVIGAADA
jgi:ATP-dependent Clp protease ATP-binding subunit ClpA